MKAVVKLRQNVKNGWALLKDIRVFAITEELLSRKFWARVIWSNYFTEDDNRHSHLRESDIYYYGTFTN